MALYLKQDFSPPVFSRRWIAMKFRPNMVINSRRHIESILESGLLFREDSVSVEQAAPGEREVWLAAGGGRSLTRGERALAVMAAAAAVAASPPRSFNRSIVLKLVAYASLPFIIRACHRSLCAGSLASLLAAMRRYLALARAAAACARESAAVHAQLESITSVISSCHTLLVRQQSALAVLLARASSALLSNTWLSAERGWHHVTRCDGDLTKVHYTFLVVQSTFLKHVSMVHFIPPSHARKLHKNHNEILYWLHYTLIPQLTAEFVENYETLDRMYRLMKNFNVSDDENKKLGNAAIDNWLYSDVHSGVARTCLELKLNLNKCNSLDIFLDSCAMNNKELNLDVLDKDIDDIVDGITKCLTAMQNSQIRLRKLKNKFNVKIAVVEKEKSDGETSEILKIEDREPVVRDEVFYFVKTVDDDVKTVQPVDSVTAPGKKEVENTKVVLSELRRKLGKREDVMRERERQALVKTMPEFKDNVPEFPRQIKFEEFVERKGVIKKIKKKLRKRRLFKKYRIQSRKNKPMKYRLNIRKYEVDKDIDTPYYEANAKLNVKSRLVTFCLKNKHIVVTKWCKYVQMPTNSNKNEKFNNSNVASDLNADSSIENAMSNFKFLEKITDDESSCDIPAENAHSMFKFSKVNLNECNEHPESKFKFSKHDLELTPTSSDSDFEISKEKQMTLLKDARRHRAVRKKNHPAKRASIDKDVDESLKPIEYSFGTGMAIASVLQVNNNARLHNMAQEEVFIGDGEVSNDSGNDEDA